MIAGPQPLVPLGKQAASLFWIDIKAEHELTQLLESSPSLRSSALLLFHCRARGEHDALGLAGGTVFSAGVNLHQRSACIHLDIAHGHHLAHFSRKRSQNLHLHFHGLEHQQAIAG